MNPWRTRAQKALTLTDSTANAATPITASVVSRNSVKRKCAASHEMSKALSLAKSGGLGNTPWVKAKISTKTPIAASNTDST